MDPVPPSLFSPHQLPLLGEPGAYGPLALGLAVTAAVLALARLHPGRPTAAGWLIGPAAAIGAALMRAAAVEPCGPDDVLCLYQLRMWVATFAVEAALAGGALVLGVAALRHGAARPVLGRAGLAALALALAVEGARAAAWAALAEVPAVALQGQILAAVGAAVGGAAALAAGIAARRFPAVWLLAALGCGAAGLAAEVTPELRHELRAHRAVTRALFPRAGPHQRRSARVSPAAAPPDTAAPSIHPWNA